MGDFRMPSLGADMDRGVLLEWKVKPGDLVQRGDIVAVVDTDKSDIEIEVFESGTVAELLVDEGVEVPVGTVLARLDPPDIVAEPAAEPEAPAEPAAEPAAPAEPVGPATLAEPAAEAVQTEPGGRVLSPLVRRLADQRGIDLDTLVGTGPGGRVTRRDVEASAPASRSAPTPRPSRAGPTTDRISASPLARRRAAQLGVDLAQVSGSGPGGAVRVGDVDLAAGAVAPTGAAGARTPERRDRAAAQRAATGALMTRSKQEIPHYYLRTTIDLALAQAWLEDQNRQRGVADRLLLSVLLLKASALAVTEVPDLNGHWVDGALHRHDAVDLGVAVALRGGGLIAPAIHDAETKRLDELMVELRDLVARARAARLRASDLTDPSITVTNLGDQGVEEVFGVIYPPQVALVGFGRVAERPWAADGMLAVRPVVTATLSADHRATTGHEGARYLATLDRLMQEPEAL